MKKKLKKKLDKTVNKTSSAVHEMADKLLQAMVPGHQLQAERDFKAAKTKEEAIRKRIRIVIEDTKVGCDYCLNVKAVIFSPVFQKNLCLGCEERLEMGMAAEILERMSPKKKKSLPKKKGPIV